MSVACSTTQSRSTAREASEQIPQNSSMVKKPQRGQGRTDSRVAAMARAMRSGWSPRAWTIQSAIRSAERGPIPGICRSCAIKSRIADGYSVFLKPSGPLLVQRRVGQLQGERLEPAKIQLQRTILLPLGAARILELRVRFRPALLPVKHDAVPERVAPSDLIARSFERQRDRLVNLMPLAHVHAAQKIDRTRDENFARKLEGARAEEDARTVEAIRDAKTPGQFDRFARREHVALPVVFHRRHDHHAGADSTMNPGVARRLRGGGFI